MKRNHLIWMLIACTVPLLLIFLAPAFGMSNNLSLLFFIVAMFGVHLFMPHGHNHNSSTSKEIKNEKHSH